MAIDGSGRSTPTERGEETAGTACKTSCSPLFPHLRFATWDLYLTSPTFGETNVTGGSDYVAC